MSGARQSEGHLLRVATRLGDPERALNAVAELRQRLDTWEAAHVDEAIADGWSWQRVAESLGVTKQAAHARHARRTRQSGDGLVVAGRARRAVQIARAEAARLGAERMETDHLLLGLLLDGDSGPVKAALDDCGITCEAVRERAGKPAPAAAGISDQPPPASVAAREALEQSMREAVARGDSRLDVEHLLLAVLHEPGGRGRKAVMATGRSPGAVERRLSKALRDQGSVGSPGP
jgi:Clp amino terminal domain, pathogenicity island component